MNRSNTIIVIVTAALLLAVGSAQTTRTSPVIGQVGRYQLLAGEHEASRQDNSRFTQKDVFRIDTVTGETSF